MFKEKRFEKSALRIVVQEKWFEKSCSHLTLRKVRSVGYKVACFQDKSERSKVPIEKLEVSHQIVTN